MKKILIVAMLAFFLLPGSLYCVQNNKGALPDGVMAVENPDKLPLPV
jgi:hypothetical protein